MLAFFKVPVTSGALLVLLLGSLQVGCQASSSAKPTTAKTVATTSTTTTTTQASTEPTTISPNSEYASVQRCYHTLAEFNRIEECVSEAVKMHGGSLIINQTVILEGLPLVHKGASHAQCSTVYQFIKCANIAACQECKLYEAIDVERVSKANIKVLMHQYCKRTPLPDNMYIDSNYKWCTVMGAWTAKEIGIIVVTVTSFCIVVLLVGFCVFRMRDKGSDIAEKPKSASEKPKADAEKATPQVKPFAQPQESADMKGGKSSSKKGGNSNLGDAKSRIKSSVSGAKAKSSMVPGKTASKA